MDNALALAIAAPTAVAIFSTVAWIVSIARNASAQRAQAHAAVQENIRDLLKAAMEFNIAVTNWHGAFGALRARMPPFALSAAEFTAGLLDNRGAHGFVDGLKTALEWGQRSTARQEAVLFGPMARMQEYASRLLTSDAGDDATEACMALMDAIEATTRAYARKGSTAKDRKVADAQYNVAIGLLAEAARSAVKPRRQGLRRKTSAPGLLASVRNADTTAHPDTRAVAAAAAGPGAAAARLHRPDAEAGEPEQREGGET